MKVTLNVLGTGTWSSGGNMNSGRAQGAGFGSATAGVAAGGDAGALVEEYNGTSWSPGGALITGVINGSPAEEGGIQEGDVIIAFNDQMITDPSNLKNVVSLTPPNSSNRVKVLRNGSKKTIEVLLKELPEDPKQYSSLERVRSNEFGLQLKEITESLKEKYNITDNDVLVVTKIDKGGEAFSKGLREGDIIKRVGTEKVKTIKDFKKLIDQSREDGTLLLLVKKPNGGSKFYTLNF